ncbi:WxL protein peptidoglycan domain-containing protein [Micromonospora sp. NPDC000089]|uniref:WxL protein peptidoglycan domain-containing protein n=1 Tax=unclassified Micromonospora TaxID=2617518 RepID=UPI00369A5CBA
MDPRRPLSAAASLLALLATLVAVPAPASATPAHRATAPLPVSAPRAVSAPIAAPRAVSAPIAGPRAVSAPIAAPRPGGANPELRWAVQPAGATGTPGRNQFEYQSGAGTKINDRVAISNLSRGPLTFTVYATDAYSAADGAFALLPGAEKPTGLGSWISLPRRSYTVPAGKRLEIPFRVTVPSKATPGDHAGGIIASMVERQTNPSGQQVDVDRRVAARVYLRVEGELAPEVRIEQLSTDYRTPAMPLGSGDLGVHYRVRNSGNVRTVGGEATLRIRGPLGTTLADAGRVELPELLPGGEVVLDRDLRVFPAGSLDAIVTVNPVSAEGRLPAVSRSVGRWAPPWSVLGLLLIVVAVVALVVVARRRRRILDEEPLSAPEPVPAR